MPIFSENDGSKLINTFLANKEDMRICEFDYFSSVAVDYYMHFIMQNREYLLEKLNDQAKYVCVKNTIQVPIEITQTVNKYYKKPSIGRVFYSTSGLHQRCMYDIYRKSDFQARMNYMLSDSNKFFITLDFNLEDNGEEMRHTCTIWLNYRLAGNIPEDKQIAYKQQHEKVSDIIY